jgi:E3 ubiquitin-protein ligase UBR7
MYKVNGCLFLTNSKDTIDYYETKGKEQDKTDEAIEEEENKLLLGELEKLNRVSQIEFISNLNEFKQELKDFLASFASNGKVVKRENIVDFFDDLNKRKKQKLDTFTTITMSSCK